MSKTLIEKIEMQINHAKNCMDVDGTNKGFIKGLEFVKNVLLPDLQNEKDHRIAELEKENEEKEDKILDLKSYNSDLKETISKLSFSAVRCQAINDEVCQYILDNELLKKENAELKAKLENSILPKFKVGDEVWVNATQMNFKIEPEQQTINGIDYYYKLKTRPYWNALEFELFATEQEARERLEELNGKEPLSSNKK